MKTAIGFAIPKNQPLILYVFENETTPCRLPQSKILLELAKQEGFKGKENSTSLLHPKNGSPSRQVILVGLGDKKKCNAETLRRATASGIRKIHAISQQSVSILSPQILNDSQKETVSILEGAYLANYKFVKYKSKNESKPVKECALIIDRKNLNETKKGEKIARILSNAACFVRDLVNEPPTQLNPSKVAEIAKKIADDGESAGISIQIFDKEKIEEMKMGALLGVARGSAEPPVFVHLHYKPENPKKKIALVGKGITFDSGGLSLKPSQSMEEMKMDMAGAASVLGVFKALPYLKPNVEIHGILALCENMPGGRASKPGDIFQAMNGKTIEVLNTDAEGRLILADALAYTVKQNPDLMIDIATLTGACITALGSLVAGVMGNDDQIFKNLQKAGEESGEKLWQLPLVQDYKEGIKSPIADIKNITSYRGEAGAIVGGLFLEEFVNKKPWAHIDIAGPAWSDKEHLYYSQGGTGYPVRTLLHYILNLQF